MRDRSAAVSSFHDLCKSFATVRKQTAGWDWLLESVSAEPGRQEKEMEEHIRLLCAHQCLQLDAASFASAAFWGMK